MPRKRTEIPKDARKELKPPVEDGSYVLRLYVTGLTPRSTQAILNIKKICEDHLHGR